MTRPLIVTDCDEVLLHMVRHFRDWLDVEHQVALELETHAFAKAMRRHGETEPLGEKEMWRLLGLFFDTQMDSQQPIAGAVEAINSLQERADVVVLTNLTDSRNEARVRQLQRLGIEARVFTNQGPKGGALSAIVGEYSPSVAVFIDDIASHHQSAAEHVPTVRRLHFCGEPAIAPHVPCAHRAGAAHARIDTWAEALPWINGQLEELKS
ncbi:HAD family hydrolase [Aurantiacibacter xanthus]|uniref:HAD family hydrolase n=1 Tax=Aurantiacibacter xanthus TaxID=1784712 RepID=A0A3A1PAR1_9SPHN|nr:HAD family hydrolase [Aurantiacibacter xanthus]RIV90861.1 HAD family hydrolase [Aurantiacibacter xanthus]